MLLSSFPLRQEISRQFVHVRYGYSIVRTLRVGELAATRAVCAEKRMLVIRHDNGGNAAVRYCPLGHADLLTLDTEEDAAHIVRAEAYERRTVTV